MSKNKLSVGDKIPEFQLPDEKGNLHTISPSNSKRRVIYFYPKNNTKVCTAQACSFRDWHTDFIELGYEVIGISADSVDSHKAFSTKHNLAFTLLSDAKGRVRKQFGVSAMLGLISGRKTFVVDEQGTIEFAYEAMMEGEEHILKTLEYIKSKS